MEKESKLVPFLFLLSFNALQFSTYVLKLPPLFLLSKGFLGLVFLGGFLRLVRGDRSSKLRERFHTDLFTSDTVDRVVKFLSRKVNLVFVQTKSVVLWDDPVKSLYSLVVLYLLSELLKVVPSVLVVFVLVWVFFLYFYMNEFLRKNVYTHFEPYVKEFVNFMYKMYNSVPRLNENKLL
ncbi:uncharacterized protein TA06220 [Theileria annulata]|uniref:Reticulon-like protein n=1 Tax=Theileria annulata TaxID=5874 RepID=Q4UI80_THEAN|nr:uncharacterized protein TA06220 [Theileria annulata]CAI73209.1 hypothetical protein TA06220 [Theileria annulata]|eukprot:XP_953887.1 hypothetical protein TA06220 [Theileria annulata]